MVEAMATAMAPCDGATRRQAQAMGLEALGPECVPVTVHDDDDDHSNDGQDFVDRRRTLMASETAPPGPTVMAATTSALPPSMDKILSIRPLLTEDIAQVRGLHEEWFPIRYNQSFYDFAAHGIWRETGHPLFARVAVEVSQCPPPVALALDDGPQQLQRQRQRQQQESILGAVMASTIPLASVDDVGLIDTEDTVHTHVMYILTLGSRSSVRRRGIASTLVAECVEEAQRLRHCGAVYLHVKSDNTRALRFYEKNGFRNLRYLDDYYVIDGVRHSAYLYIRYVNGATAQFGWLDAFTRPIWALFSMATSGFKKLLHGLLEDDEDGSYGDATSINQRTDPFMKSTFVSPTVEETAATMVSSTGGSSLGTAACV